jgi:hypothetical protein
MRFILFLSLCITLIAPDVALARSEDPRQEPAATQDAIPPNAAPSKTDLKWALVREITPGTPILIEMKDGKTVGGKFREATDAEIVLEKAGLKLKRANVQRVFLAKNRSKIKSVLRGAYAGAGIGIGSGILVALADRSRTGANFAPVTFGFVGTFAGGTIGFIRSRKKQRGLLIYDANF